MLNELSTRHQLIIHAPEEYTNYPYRHDHQPDILDLTISKNLNTTLHQIVINEMNSDHLPIIISLAQKLEYKPRRERLIDGKINWIKFQEKLQNCHYIQPTTNKNSIDISI